MKKVFSLIIITALLLSGAITVYAEEVDGGDWYVYFSSDAKMESNFTAVEGDKMSEALYALQPGDRATFYMDIRNDYVEATDWYMANKVLDSLEDDSLTAKGGAYTYRLTYTGPSYPSSDPLILFDSNMVGGAYGTEGNPAGEGLLEATNALQDWLYLDTLNTGDRGQIFLQISLDGETQGNAYQDTLADLQMRFAVELQEETSRRVTIVKTGDEDLLPYIIAAGISGLILLIFAIYSMKKGKEERRKGAAR